MRISIDSRTIKKGEYFVPFKGNNFDGHDFIDSALKNGAKGIIEESELYKIVQKKLDKKKPFIIAVAGSIGKSTFRSYLTSILSQKFKVLESDLNTKIGFCLSIVNNFSNQSIIVAEVGIDRIGEMENTASLVLPDASVITKLGEEHLQYFKSFKNVIIEESKIFNFTRKYKYINSADKKYLLKFSVLPMDAVIYDNQVVDRDIVNNINKLEIPDHEKVYLLGIYTLINRCFEFDDKLFIAGLHKLKKPKGRFNFIYLRNGSLLIDDTYNAVCDKTIISGIKYCLDLAKRRNFNLVAVIPNMVENGRSANRQHKRVSLYLNKVKLENLYIVGNNLEYYKKYLNVDYKEYPLADEVNIKLQKNTIYYIKATRRYKGPELVEKITSK